MGFDLLVGPLDGIDGPAADADKPWYDVCLAMFDEVNEYLRSIGLPPHIEPRSRGGGLHLGYRQPLLDLGALDALLPEELEATFDQVLIAGPNTLFVPVDLPGPVSLLADGEHFRLGSVPQPLFQSAWLQRLVGGESMYDLHEAADLYGARLDEPLDGFETQGSVGQSVSETLC